MNQPHRIALVGIGKIARDQHIPTIAASSSFEFAATASRNGRVDGVEAFGDLDELLAKRPDIDCVVLCTPPQYRYRDAAVAIESGRHVLLEKPPGATLGEVEYLRARAIERGVSLFASWHSRFADCVEEAGRWVAANAIEQVKIAWKEDVRQWHPGQDWIWQRGGLGVFDPGINALSILTAIMPGRIRLKDATLAVPANRHTAIAAELVFEDRFGARIDAEFDWRQEGEQTWQISVRAKGAEMVLSQGGSRMAVDGSVVRSGTDREYTGIYERFGELVETGQIDVDLEPMIHVFDALAIGRYVEVAAFEF